MIPEVFVIALPFLTLPITTRYFGLEEFGIIAIFSLCQLPFVVFNEIGVGYVMPAMWFDLNKSERRSFLSTLLWISCGFSVLSILVVTPFYKWVFGLLANDSVDIIISLYPWMVLSVFSKFLLPVYLNWIVLTEKSKLFMKVKLLESIISTGFTVYLIINTQNVVFVITVSCLIIVVFNVIRLLILLPHISYDFNQLYFKKTIKVGYPIFFRSLFNLVSKSTDKYILSALSQASHFALYSFAIRFQSMFEIINNQFSRVYSPRLYKSLSEGKTSNVNFNRIFFGWFYLLFLGVGLFFLIGESLIIWISNGIYADSYAIVLVLTVGFIASGTFSGAAEPLVYNKKTGVILFVSIFTTCICTPITFLLIKYYSVIGGATGLVLYIFIKNILTSILKYKLTKIIYIELKTAIYLVFYCVVVGLYVYGEYKLSTKLFCLEFIILTMHLLIIERMAILKSIRYIYNEVSQKNVVHYLFNTGKKFKF